MEADKVLDRLAALLDAATPGPWAYDDGVTDDETGERGKPASIYGTGMVGGLPLFCGVPPEGRDDNDGRAICAIRNAAPALIRLARATVEFEKHEIRTEVKCYAELLNAIKALGEVRL